MASTTTNLGLTKPAYTDSADVAVINSNMDILDTKIGAIGNTSVASQIGTLSEQIAHIDTETVITNLSDIPVNTKGRIVLGASISPTGSQISRPYECYGSSAYRTLIVGETNINSAYVNMCHNNTWKGWKQISPNISNINYGSSQSPVTNLDDIANNTSGNIVFAAAVSPVSGSVVSGSYWKTANDDDNYSIMFVRQYTNDMFIYSKAGGTVKGWKRLVASEENIFAKAITSSIGGGSTAYLNHTGTVMLFTDRGGLWVEGVLGRALVEIANYPLMTVTRETNNKMKIVSSNTYSTQMTAFGYGDMSFSAT